jgi:hypothetical protein
MSEDAEETDGKLSILRIVDLLSPSAVPVTLPFPLTVITQWRGPRGTNVSFTIRVVRPDKTTQSVEVPVIFAANDRGRAIARLNGLSLNAYGDYQVQVIQDNDVILSEILAVVPQV